GSRSSGRRRPERWIGNPGELRRTRSVERQRVERRRTRMPHMIEASGLMKQFSEVHALAGLDLEVPEGTVLGLLGPNGAGKTTAVRILTTLLVPDRGEATVAGADVRRDPELVRSRIGLSGQYAAVDEHL